MKFLIRLGHLFLSYLLRPVLLWVRSNAYPEHLKEHLDVGDSPVIYVLPKRSIMDYLVLRILCRRHGIPEPDLGLDFNRKRRAVCLFLEKTGPVKRIRRLKPSHVLLHIVKQVKEKTGEQAKIVPVSPFWGKDPGTEEPSIFRLIFNDDEDAGWLQRFCIVWVQGRNNNVYFGKPITLDETWENDDTNAAARKLRRLLRIHFRRQRNMVLGQKLYEREQVISRVAGGKLVRHEIEKESKGKPNQLREIENRARHYARELSADQTYSMIRTFELILGKLWNKLFSGVEIINLDIATQMASQNYEIVYVPTHRSHLDYLLVNYTIYKSGLPTPHTAAGINLNFFPMGWFLRRAGAFFIRRSFRGNRLYTAVVEEYMHYLLTQGYPISFFPEGGRSRTGRPLPLRTGMLAMVVKSFLRSSQRPVVFVPVYIGYDKVMEVKSYLAELGGGKKKKESIFLLLQARKLLKAYYGKAYMSFGEPIILSRFLDEVQPGWKEENDEKPEWLNSHVHELAERISRNMNDAAVLSPVSLIGLALLGTSQKALPVEELELFIKRMIQLHKIAPYHPHVKLVRDNVDDIIASAQKLQSFSVFQHAAGDVIFANDEDAALISYYRNNISHVFALPSLVARFFQQQEEIDATSLARGCAEIYGVLRDEMFLRWPEEEIEGETLACADAMVKIGLLRKIEPDIYRRPPAQSDNGAMLDILSQVLGTTFDRFIITAALLAKHSQRGLVNSDEFMLQCQRMAQRFAILSGLTNPEIAEKSYIQKHIQLLKRRGLLITVDENNLRIDHRIAALAQYSQRLLSSDALRSVERIFKSTNQENTQNGQVEVSRA